MNILLSALAGFALGVFVTRIRFHAIIDSYKNAHETWKEIWEQRCRDGVMQDKEIAWLKRRYDRLAFKTRPYE